MNDNGFRNLLGETVANTVNGFRNPLDEPVGNTVNWFRDQLDFGRQAVRICFATLLISLLGPMGVAAADPVSTQPKTPTGRLLIIGSSSIYAQLIPDGRRAGLARRATLYDSLRGAHENTLIVDAGDFTPHIRGSGADARDERWRRVMQMVRTMKQLGYQAWTPGDTELCLGREGLDRIAKEIGGVCVSANLRDSVGTAIFPASLILTIGGISVGITAVTDPRFLTPAGPSNSADLDDFRLLDPDSTLSAVVEELTGKVDVIVCLAHLQARDIGRLVTAVPVISAFVGGHRPGFMPNGEMVGGVPIVRAGDHGYAAGLLELEVDRELGVVDCRGKSLPVNDTIGEMPSLADSLRAFEEREAARYPNRRVVRYSH